MNTNPACPSSTNMLQLRSLIELYLHDIMHYAATKWLGDHDCIHEQVYGCS